MFDAVLLSLSDGQSYKHVTVLDPSEHNQYGIIPQFEEWTLAFVDNNKRILAHAFNVKVIHLTTVVPTKLVNGYPFERIVLAGNIVYGPGRVIPSAELESNNIPDIFRTNFGLIGQLTFTTHEGVFIASDYNVTTMTLCDGPMWNPGIAKRQTVDHCELPSEPQSDAPRTKRIKRV